MDISTNGLSQLFSAQEFKVQPCNSRSGVYDTRPVVVQDGKPGEILPVNHRIDLGGGIVITRPCAEKLASKLASLPVGTVLVLPEGGTTYTHYRNGMWQAKTAPGKDIFALLRAAKYSKLQEDTKSSLVELAANNLAMAA